MKKNQSITTMVTALTARTQFDQILRRARTQNERFIVDRRGEPQVIILSIDDFLKHIAPEQDVLAAIREESKKKKTDKLSMRDIDHEITAYRRKLSKTDAVA
ncbi:MAG: type II toxin-antitoxin system Phd/YefM family antitoxin [Pyrinomonadaceae bacterium]